MFHLKVHLPMLRSFFIVTSKHQVSVAFSKIIQMT